MNTIKGSFDLGGLPKITYKTAEVRKFEMELEKSLRDFEIFKEAQDEQKRKENFPMKVTYNGFTGELEKLERTHYGDHRYSLFIYDGDNNCTHSFTMVKLEDVKFLGGEVSFGG